MHERDVIERIFKRITETPTGCWIVDGWSDGKGYRNISINNKTCKVHRVMFEWFWRRKLRKNVQVDHKCCNRSCCNPLHLQSCLNKKNSQLRSKRKSKNVTQENVDQRRGSPPESLRRLVSLRCYPALCSSTQLHRQTRRMEAMKTAQEIKKEDLSEPYFESQQWCVDEQLYPETRGFIQRRFDTQAEANQFIEGAK